MSTGPPSGLSDYLFLLTIFQDMKIKIMTLKNDCEDLNLYILDFDMIEFYSLTEQHEKYHTWGIHFHSETTEHWIKESWKLCLLEK